MELRVNLDRDNIEKMRKRLNRRRNADVIDDALAFLDWALKETEEGNIIISRSQKENGNEKQVVMPGF